MFDPLDSSLPELLSFREAEQIIKGLIYCVFIRKFEIACHANHSSFTYTTYIYIINIVTSLSILPVKNNYL